MVVATTMYKSHGAEDAKIMLADETLLNEDTKKWLVGMKKEINERREYEAARAVMEIVGQEARMHAEQEARMQTKHAAWMVSDE